MDVDVTAADVRSVMQVKEELKDVYATLDAVRKENSLYKKLVDELTAERDLEYRARRIAKLKCFWMKSMSEELVDFASDVLGYLEGQTRGGGGVGLEIDVLKMLRQVPVEMKSLITILEDAKVKGELIGVDVALEKIVKNARELQTKLRGDEDARDDAGPTGLVQNELLKRPEVVPVPVATDRRVDRAAGVVQGVRQSIHAVNPKNPRECLCGFWSSVPKNVSTHVKRLTTHKHEQKGTLVCHICGDRFLKNNGLQVHLACHKTHHPTPDATIQQSGCSESGQQVVSAMMSEEPGPSNNVAKSGMAMALPSPSASAKTPEPQDEMDQQDDQ